jgi:ubiquinone/menaquinone biosynthesis C-methylase UbiE
MADDRPPEEIIEYYGRGAERGRLLGGEGELERVRTQELLMRYLPPAPAVVYDVGGAAGVYACRLAGQGYEVHLVDPVPLHVEQAREASDAQPEHPLASIQLGDARELPFGDSSADAVLLLGPLYHLTERDDRVQALREARRVLRGGGVVLAAGISRFASVLDGLLKGFLGDPEFVRIVERDLAEGQHRNPTGRPGYFTTAFFHHPQEMAAEFADAGLHHEATLAVEGPGWCAQPFEDYWEDEARREQLLLAVRLLESEPSVLGATGHMMAVGRRPSC